jgi:hypothetical protein
MVTILNQSDPRVAVEGGAADYREELWASKNLDTIWLPRRDNWHDPCLQAVAPRASAEVVRTSAPQEGQGMASPLWFWRVSPTFGAWVCRAIRRADQSKAALPVHVPEAFRLIRAYLEEQDPCIWSLVEQMSLDPVLLPGEELIRNAIEMARYGLVPKWEGWEKLAQRQPESPPPPPAPIPPVATRPVRAARPTLF